MDLEKRYSREELESIKGGATVVEVYFMREESIFNKRSPLIIIHILNTLKLSHTYKKI